MKKIFEKYILLRYVVGSYVKVFLCSLAAFAVIFTVLKFSGLYARIENALDLKYNSPFVLVPLYGFLILAVLCVVIGFLMYFYKYKRAKSKSLFFQSFYSILNEEQISEKK